MRDDRRAEQPAPGAMTAHRGTDHILASGRGSGNSSRAMCVMIAPRTHHEIVGWEGGIAVPSYRTPHPHLLHGAHFPDSQCPPLTRTGALANRSSHARVAVWRHLHGPPRQSDAQDVYVRLDRHYRRRTGPRTAGAARLCMYVPATHLTVTLHGGGTCAALYKAGVCVCAWPTCVVSGS